MTACDQCGLKKISLHLKEGHVKSNLLNKYLIMYFKIVTMSSTDATVPIVAVVDCRTVAQRINPYSLRLHLEING